MEKKHIYLCFGGVGDEAWGRVNGQAVSCNSSPHSERSGFAERAGVVYSQIGDNSNGKQTKLVIVVTAL